MALYKIKIPPQMGRADSGERMVLGRSSMGIDQPMTENMRWEERVTGLNSSAHGIPGTLYRPFPNRVTRIKNEDLLVQEISRKRRAYDVGKESEGIARTLKEFRRFSRSSSWHRHKGIGPALGAYLSRYSLYVFRYRRRMGLARARAARFQVLKPWRKGPAIL